MRARAVLGAPCRTRFVAVFGLVAGLLGLVGLPAPAHADPVTLTGHVTRGLDGSPVAGVAVIVKDYSGAQEVARTTTDSRGFYSLSSVESRDAANVCATQDIADADKTLADACQYTYPSRTVDLVMERVTTVRGSVRPIAGATLPGSLGVALFTFNGDAPDGYWLRTNRATVDPDSHEYEIPEVLDGDYRACAYTTADFELVGCAGGTGVEDADDVLVRGAPLSEDLAVPSRGHLEGTLRDTSGLGNVTGAACSFYRIVSDGRGGTRLGDNVSRVISGTAYSIDLAPGRYRFGCRLKGDRTYLRVWNGGGTSSATAPDIVVTSGATTTADIVGVPEATISGRVTTDSAASRPVRVRAVNTLTGEPVDAQQSSDGSYVVRGLGAGTYRVEFGRIAYAGPPYPAYAAEFYVDRAESLGEGAATAVTVTAGQQLGGIDAALGAGAVATGQLLDADGAPVSNAVVKAYTDDGHLVSREVTTVRGSFSIAGLQASAYKFSVDATPAGLGATWYLGATGTLVTDRTTAVARAVGASGLDLGTLRLAGGLPDEAPTVISEPSIVGTSTVGATLTADPGTWSRSGLSFSYRWLWKNRLGQAHAIEGATGATYRPTSEDTGRQLGVTVSTSKPGAEEATRTTAWSDPVGSPTLKSQTAPVLSRAEPVVGQPLSVSGGTWSATPTSMSYQWYRDGTPIQGATSSSYVPIAADTTEKLSVVEVAQRPGFGPGSATVVSLGPTIAAGSQPAALNIAPPTISGKAHVGETLTATPGSWNITGLAYGYVWLADELPIPGATKSVFTPTTAQLSKSISVRVTATRSGYRPGTAESRTVGVVSPALVNTYAPDITGDAKVNSTLTAGRGNWSIEVNRFAYQWYSGSTAIEGATSTTYTIPWNQRGAELSVRVTPRVDGYDPVSASSRPTSPVLPGTFTVRSQPSIAGSGVVGAQLSYVRGVVSPPPGQRLQWLRSGVATGVSTPTYAVTAADRGKTLSVQTTYRRLGYQTLVLTTPGVAVPTT